MRGILVRRLAALFSALALLGLPGVTRAQSVPYEIHVILSLTGTAAFLGTQEQSTLRVIEAMTNRNGGLHGRPVKFDILDDTSSPKVAVQLVNELTAKKVPLIFGPGITAMCNAVAPLVEEHGPLTYCLSPTIFPKSGSHMFMQAPSIDDVQPVVLRYFKERGMHSLALVTSLDASGQDFAERIDRTLASPEFAGIVKVTMRETFAPTDLSVAAQMVRIKSAKPDAILTYTVGTPFGTLLHGIHEAGIQVPIFGSGGNFTYGQMEQYADFLPDELILNGTRGITDDPTATGAVKRAQAVYQDALRAANLRSTFATSIPWDPMMIVLDALRTLGTEATSEQLYTYLENLKGWNGIEGTYDFSTRDQRGIRASGAALFRYNLARREFEQVYPMRKR
jgi:branched-chain amino acid transport system substrate-binding protein